MPLTGMLGTPQSQPGQLQPGYTCAGTAIWRGPFPMRITFGNFDPGAYLDRPVGTQFNVPGSVASQMAAGDPIWWEFH